MIDQDQFLALTTSIVAEVMPDEQIAFEISGPQITEDLFATGDVGGGSKAGNEFQFIDAVEHTLTFVTLMAGTFEAVRKLYVNLRGKSVDSSIVAARWRDELKTAGLGSEMIETIVVKFEKDLGKLVSASAAK
jgi:hypothetical protein